MVLIALFSGHVETTVQALRLIHAAHQEVIPYIARHLNNVERKAMVKSGTVLVISVDESEWTDDFLWSPPQVVGNFLVYRQIEHDFHGDKGLVKPGTLIKKSITVTIKESDLQLISYYAPEDIRSGKLEPPTLRPDIMNLDMPPHIFCLTNLRSPPRVKIGSDGKPYIVSESEDPEELEDSARTPEPGARNYMSETQTNPLIKSADEWSMQGGPPVSSLRGREVSPSPISPPEDYISQATNAFSSPLIHDESDRGSQPARRRHQAGTTSLQDNELHSEAPKNMGHRRRSRKSRAPREDFEMKGESEFRTEAGSIANGIFANQHGMNPFIPNTLASIVPSFLVQPWAYYPPPAFMFMMPLPIVPIVPMFGPSQWTNINSGNVTNVHMYDANNNNSTNVDIRKVHGKEQKGRTGRKK